MAQAARRPYPDAAIVGEQREDPARRQPLAGTEPAVEQDDDRPLPVTGLDHPPHAPQVGPAQVAIGVEGGVDRPLVTRHAALQVDRERAGPAAHVGGELPEEPSKTCLDTYV